MKDSQKSKNTASIRPTFVPTEPFYKCLEIYLFNLANARMESDLQKQLVAITGVLMMTAPFIKETYKEELLLNLKQIENLLQVKRTQIQIQASRKLFELEMKIIDYSKHILLPHTLDEAEEEIEWEKYI